MKKYISIILIMLMTFSLITPFKITAEADTNLPGIITLPRDDRNLSPRSTEKLSLTSKKLRTDLISGQFAANKINTTYSEVPVTSWYLPKKSNGTYEGNLLTLIFDDVGVYNGSHLRAKLEITRVAFTKEDSTYAKKNPDNKGLYGNSDNKVFVSVDTSSVLFGLDDDRVTKTNGAYNGMMYAGDMWITYNVSVYSEKLSSDGGRTGQYETTTAEIPLSLLFTDIDQVHPSLGSREAVRIGPIDKFLIYKWPSFKLDAKGLGATATVYEFRAPSDLNTEGDDVYYKSGFYTVSKYNSNGRTGAAVQSGGNMVSGLRAFTSYPNGSLVIQKRSANTTLMDGHFENIEYTIYTSEGKVFDKPYVLNEAGRIANVPGGLITLPAGNYTIKETKTNDYYDLNEKVSSFTIRANETTVLEAPACESMEDNPSSKRGLFSKKMILQEGYALPDDPSVLKLLKYTLTPKNPQNGQEPITINLGKKYDCFTGKSTDLDDPSDFEFENLPYGEYSLQEDLDSVKAAQDMANKVLNIDGEFIIDDVNKIYDVTVGADGTKIKNKNNTDVLNTWKGPPVPPPDQVNIEVNKYEITASGDPGTHVDGITFTLYDLDHNVILSRKTNAQGKATFSCIEDHFPPGTYVVEETSFDPDKYLDNQPKVPGWDKPSYKVTISDEKDKEDAPFINEEKPDPSINVIKTGDPNVTASMTQYKLTGIKYSVYTTEADAGAERDALGEITLTQLGGVNPVTAKGKPLTLPGRSGDVYVKETYVPADSGYTKNDTIYGATLVPGATVEVQATDAIETRDYFFNKIFRVPAGVDPPDPRTLVFTLENVNNPDLTYTVIPEADGTVKVPNVVYGTYTVTESGLSGDMVDITRQKRIVIDDKTSTTEPLFTWENAYTPQQPDPGSYTVEIKKIPGEDTQSLSDYNLGGIKYNVYRDADPVSDPSHTTLVGTITLQGSASMANGSLTFKIEENPPDTVHLWIQEDESSLEGTNYEYNPEVKEIDAVKDQKVTLNEPFEDTPKYGSLRFQKVIQTNVPNVDIDPTKLTFTLTNLTNSSAVPYTEHPDSSGNVIFPKVLIGEYRLNETGLENYNINGGSMKSLTAPQTLEIEAGENTIPGGKWENEYNREDPKKYTLRIEKRSSEELFSSSYSMTGISYNVYSDPECSKKLTTIKLVGGANSATGSSTFILKNTPDRMPVYVKENAVPKDSGFKQDDTVYEATAVADQTVNVTTALGGPLEDEPEKGDLSFTKVIQPEPAGAQVPSPEQLVFTLTNTENPGEPYNASPDSNGLVKFTGLPLGKYILTESGFENYDNIPEYEGWAMIDFTGSKEVIIRKGDNELDTENNEYINQWKKDPPNGAIDIIKRTDNPGNVDFTKFHFTVTKIDGSKVVASNEPLSRNGVLTVDSLEPGMYRIEENLTAEQLKLYMQPAPVEVEVKSKDTTHAQAIITNPVRTSKVKVIKKCIDGKVGDLRFTIKGIAVDGTEVTERSARTEQTVIGGETVGVAIFTGLLPGDYTVEEVSFEPYGYVSSSKGEGDEYPKQTVTTDGIHDEELTFVNTPVSFSLRKTEILEDGTATNDPVSDAGYTLYRISDLGRAVTDEDELDQCEKFSFTTDGNGKIETKLITGGTYWVYETTFPDDYYRENTPPPITGLTESSIGKFIGEVTLDPDHPDASLTDTNRRMPGYINVTKVDDAGNPVEGAEFALFTDPLCLVVAKNIDGKEMRAVTDQFGSIMIPKTDGSGEYEPVFSNLRWGKYYLKETKAPRGYDIDDAVEEVNIGQYGRTIEKQKVNNRAKGRVELTKLRKGTDEKLNGAIFDLYTNDNERIKTGLVTGGDNNGDGTPDGDGAIKVEGLDWGFYYFKEVEAPPGYSVSSELTRFAVNMLAPQNTYYKVSMENEPAPAELVVTVKMTTEDFWDDHGDPTYFVVVDDGHGGIRKQAVTFDRKYIDEATDGAGYVAKSVSFSVDADKDYDIWTVPADRYILQRDYNGGSIPGPVTDLAYNKGMPKADDSVTVNIPATKKGAATFVYTKHDWSVYGDKTAVTNMVKKNRSYVALAAAFKGDPEKVEANMLFKPDEQLIVHALFDDGSADELSSIDYVVTDQDGHTFDRWPSAAGPYMYTVSATINGVTREAPLAIKVLDPKKVKVYFHTNCSSSISGKDGTEACSIDGSSADYIEMWQHRPLSAGIPAARYNVTWTGHELTGWFHDSDSIKNELDPAEEITGDTHFYARWDLAVFRVNYYAATPDPTVTVTGEPKRQLKDYGDSVQISSSIPKASKGYEFLGWSTQQNKKTEANVQWRAGDTYSADANLNLYAVWKPSRAAIRYHANDPEFSRALPVKTSSMPADTTIEYGDTKTAPSAPTRAGYKFTGWGVNENGTGKVYVAGERLLPAGTDLTEAQQSGGIDLYAQWEQLHLGATELSWDDVKTIGDAGIAPDFFDLDFRTIRSDISDDGSIGSTNLSKYTKTTTIGGNNVHAMIIGFGHDETEDGGTVAISFMTCESAGNNTMEQTGKAVSGYKNSTMRTTTLPNLYTSMPNDVRASMVTMKKKSVSTSGAVDTTTDRLALPSAEELYGIYAYTAKP